MGKQIKGLAKYYPILSVVGPRQSGKTTMLRDTFADFEYISLEDPDVLRNASKDPRNFINKYSDRVFFDEAQKWPPLFSYLQTVVDKDRRPGRFVLSGSHNFLLHKGISQSLAGRVSLSTLLPFDFMEMENTELWPDSLAECVINGFYPGKLVNKIPSKIFYSNYISTYIERDVLDLINVGNRRLFRTFVQKCALCAGQIFNYSSISRDLGVSANTIKSWISVLEASFIIFTLPMYHRNFGKRLIKSPKLYFHDTGLLAHLLKFNDPNQWFGHKHAGALFENFIISEMIKLRYHANEKPEFYYFRDSNGMEIDLIVENSEEVQMYEIKSSTTFDPDYLINMHKLLKRGANMKPNVIYSGEERFQFLDAQVIPWNGIR